MKWSRPTIVNIKLVQYLHMVVVRVGKANDSRVMTAQNVTWNRM